MAGLRGWERVEPAGTIAAGVLAAACLGKVAPVSVVVGQAFRLSPLVLGAAISVISLVTAVVATPAGLWLRRRDSRQWLAVGLGVMAVAGGAMALMPPSGAALICLRAVEGIGYLLIVLGGPGTLILQVSALRGPVALALWAACTPAGLALSAAAGGFAASRTEWREWFAALAIMCAGLAGVMLMPARRRTMAAPAAATADAHGRSKLVAPLLLACGFGVLSLMTVAIVSLMPSYLATRAGMSVTAAGAATAVVAATSIPGNACAAVLLRRGLPPGMLTCSLLAGPPLAAATFSGGTPLPARVGAAATFIFAVGIAASAAYASLPKVTQLIDDLHVANGIMIQAGSLGAMTGPPIFAAITGLRHWHLIGYLVTPAAILSTATMAGASLASRYQAVPASDDRRAG